MRNKKLFSLFMMVLLLLTISCKTAVTEDMESKKSSYKLDYAFFPATAEENGTAIILLGGSEGGVPIAYGDFSWLTDLGSPVLSLGYFGTENTPKELKMIPLEYFKQAIDWYRNQEGIKGKKIVLYGNSKGSEAALLIASNYSEIEGVIANVPSSVVYQSFTEDTSCWSLNGEPVPYLPYAGFNLTPEEYQIGAFTPLYLETLKQKELVNKATISVEKINGPILLLSGEEDIMWPSTYMGDMIVNRLKENNFNFHYRHVAYEDAGHTLNEFFTMGGTYEGNMAARIGSGDEMAEFLNMF